MVVSSSSRRGTSRTNSLRSDRPGIPGQPFRQSRRSASPVPVKKMGLRSSKSAKSVSKPVPFAARNSRTTLQAMPDRMPLPRWLQLLKKTEKISLVVAFGLVSAAVGTYGWAVYSQQQWGTNFNHLNTLRRDERQLLKSSELMKNDIARHNDPKQYGLVPRNAEHIVVIPPAPLRSALPTRNSGPDPKAKPITPIGY
jgi:hypothetical protein